jgi:hypothetical protein
MDANVIIPAGTIVSLSVTLFFVWWRGVRRVRLEVEKADGTSFILGFSKAKTFERPIAPDAQAALDKNSERVSEKPPAQ